jgi:hypothetical protein
VVEQILRAQDERAQRLATARAAINALRPPERDELLASLIREAEAKGAPSRKRNGGRLTLRGAVMQVMADGRSRSTAEIYQAVLTLVPEARKASVATTVMQLNQAGRLITTGSNGRAGLYAAPSAGGPSV